MNLWEEWPRAGLPRIYRKNDQTPKPRLPRIYRKSGLNGGGFAINYSKIDCSERRPYNGKFLALSAAAIKPKKAETIVSVFSVIN